MNDKTLARLEQWCHANKARAVNISIDDGRGASCWNVSLWLNDPRDLIQVSESMLSDDDDSPGLAVTINAAIDIAEKKEKS